MRADLRVLVPLLLVAAFFFFKFGSATPNEPAPKASDAGVCHHRILVGMSSADHIRLRNGKEPPAGFFLSELAVPGQRLANHGFELVFANPKGNRPPMDPMSNSSSFFNNTKHWKQALAFVDDRRHHNFHSPRRYSSLRDSELDSFDGIFFPGGHAPMVDLWNNTDVGRILQHFSERQKPTAAICHGPVALAAANRTGQPWLYAGYNMTMFPTKGDKAMEGKWKGKLPFYPRQPLDENGAQVIELGPTKPLVVQDKELTTAPNPESAEPFANAFLESLERYCYRV